MKKDQEINYFTNNFSFLKTIYIIACQKLNGI